MRYAHRYNIILHTGDHRQYRKKEVRSTHSNLKRAVTMGMLTLDQVHVPKGMMMFVCNLCPNIYSIYNNKYCLHYNSSVSKIDVILYNCMYISFIKAST